MSRLWQCIMASFTPGVRVVLGLLAVTALATIIGTLSQLYDLNPSLALSGHSFWSGQIWQIVTYVLLPVSLLSFVINSLAIVFLGGALERIWARREFLFYCLLVTVGTGLAQVLFQFSIPSFLAGPAPLVFGLLAAWGFLFRHEKIMLFPGFEMTLGVAALLAGVISFTLTWLSSGLVDALIFSAGGLSGLLYLWVQARIIMTRSSQIVASERIQRLEI